jgi:hypothetical protein
VEVGSLEFPDLPLSTAVFDPIGDSILCLFGPSEELPSLEIQRISVCDLLSHDQFVANAIFFDIGQNGECD